MDRKSLHSGELPLSDLPTELQKILDYWASLKVESELPTWSAFDLFQMPSRLIPLTMVIDVADPLEQSSYRFWGSKLTSVHGSDMTGKCPYDLKPKILGDTLLSEHRALVEAQAPSSRYIVFETPSGIRHYQCLLRLPLASATKSIGHIVVVVDYDDAAIKWFEQTGTTMGDFHVSRSVSG